MINLVLLDRVVQQELAPLVFKTDKMAEFKIASKKFIYKNSIKWQGQKKGLLTSDDKPNFEVATPAEFKGHAGIWSPEDLFVAAVNSCIMTTFLYYAEKESFVFVGYKSDAEGVLERIGNRFMFSEIKVRPKIMVTSSEESGKAKELIKLSKEACLISNSIKSKVKVIPEIKIAV